MHGMGGDKKVKVLAWISYILAVIGGAAITDTFIGRFVTGVVEFFPSWLAIVAFAGGFVAMAVDLLVDGIPNRLAVYLGMVLPPVAAAVPGKLGDTVVSLSHSILAAVDGGMQSWLGVSSALGLAATSVVVSLLVARRVVAKGGR